MSPEGVPASYEDQVGMLMAEIADLCLNGKQDWQTLERLREALYPSFNGVNMYAHGVEPIVDEASEFNSKIMAEAIKKIYNEKIRDSFSYTGQPAATFNGSQWIAVKDYGAKYDPGKT